jgi:hypothetical protein
MGHRLLPAALDPAAFIAEWKSATDDGVECGKPAAPHLKSLDFIK